MHLRRHSLVLVATLFCFILGLAGSTALAFTDIGAGLPGVDHSSVAWGDYDGDGDLDILLTGRDDSSRISLVYRNDAGVFTDIAAGLPGVDYSSVAWGDYDNDGDLDILLTGDGDSGYISLVYRNDAGAFTDIAAGLPGLYWSSVAWGDYDNDGDLDILLTGWTGSSNISRIYRNDAGAFTDIGAGLTGVSESSVAWGDYDNDGDLDILLTGNDGSSYISRVYRNNAGVFTDIGAGLTGVRASSVAWGDYDSDGDLDILLTGDPGSIHLSLVYRNDAGVFTDIAAGLTGVDVPSVAWGDYDNDGDLDILLTGWDGSTSISSIYRNDAGVFTEIAAGLPGVHWSSVAWGDYDNDGDMDILLTGDDGSTEISRIYRSEAVPANSPPSPPQGLTAEPILGQVTLSWNVATDAQTPSAGLSYNLRVGTTPGGSEIISAMADPANGYRRVVQLGNAQQQISWTVELPLLWQTCYWSVQALDGAFAGSAFATEESFPTQGLLFADIGAGLTGVYDSSVAWGDYDDDGDLDILLTGDDGSSSISRIYRNDAGVFTDIAAGLPGVYRSSVAWGDYDNDGDLDILLTGDDGSSPISRVYLNDAGVFTDTAAGLTGVYWSSVAWGDYDNDGDLDILLTGRDGASDFITRIYRNDDGVFTDIAAGLTGVFLSSVSWGDYDNDGDLDILLTGISAGDPISRVYRNDEGVFTEVGAGLTGVRDSSVDWGDYDNDGDLDILLSGTTGSVLVSQVYQNDAGTFTDIGAGLEGVAESSVAWGDYDNDGDLDIFLTGTSSVGNISRVYRNDEGVFVDIEAGLLGVRFASAAWGDYDNDDDLDILLTGHDGSTEYSRIYRNEVVPANSPPAPPQGLTAEATFGQVTLSWSAATDAQTPSAGLSYNLRIGTTPGGSDLMSSMADPASGYRRVVQLGNAQQQISWTAKLPLLWQTCYWSVQTIDGAFAGSAFAPEENFLSNGHPFESIGAGLIGVAESSAAWGDYDDDGDLDIILTGYCDSGSISIVYRNDAGVFTDIGAGLTGVNESSVAWGDYDNDGDLDILLTGYTGSDRISILYRNDEGVFVDIAAGLPGVRASSVAWGDYDNDGDLDILLTGGSVVGIISRVYRNDEGVFVDIAAGLADVSQQSVAWGDYDNDGDLDILLAGNTGSGYISRIYRNDEGVFTDVGAGLLGVRNCSVAWGDYDNDGDLDILLTGWTGSDFTSRIYRNDDGVFVDIAAGLTGVYRSSVAWGDYDNDGDLDILLTGEGGSGRISRVYRNDEGVFVDITTELTGVSLPSVAWGDYDNDGDLDILLTGYVGGGQISRVYESRGLPANTPPEAPQGLAAEVVPGQVTLSWDAATDAQTPAAGLSYNLRVGTTPGGSEITSAMADLTSGWRRIVQLGNAQQQISWTVELPLVWQTYHWSVQALDGAFAGSALAIEESFLAYGEPPLIESIVDVPNDQGRQVSITWLRSGYDALGSPSPIEEYAIFRRIDDLPRGVADSPPQSMERLRLKTDLRWGLRYPPGDWHFIATVPANVEDDYSMVVPTLADSTIADGMHWSVFFVRARTDSPSIFFDCEPDSGYSVDNLEPGAPTNLAFDGLELLVWDEADEEDFDYHTVYGSDIPVFDEFATLIDYTVHPTYDVTGTSFDFYHVTTSDFAGNESEAATAENPINSTPEIDRLPTRHALHLPQPNPFRAMTTLGFDLPRETSVRLVIYDTTGRQVRGLANGSRPAGRHLVSWDGRSDDGQLVAPGVYLAKIQAGGYEKSQRLVRIE